MNKDYYDTVDRLEKLGVNREYVVGWMSGYLGNPIREEQRVNEAYNVGYEDGKKKSTEHAEAWKQ
jgi:hypothetical protein